jgi:hypothetical protein
MANNKRLFNSLLAQAAKDNGIEQHLPILERLVNQESGWNPNAKSKVGALGLMQLMPGTARGLGVTNPLDPAQNIAGGVRYFAQNLKTFGGNIPMTVASYNAGPGAVKKYKGIPPYKETQNYVRNIVGGGSAPAVGTSFSAPASVTADAGNLLDIAKQGVPNVPTAGFTGRITNKSLTTPNKAVDGLLANTGQIAAKSYLDKALEVVPQAPQTGLLFRIGNAFGSGGALPQADEAVVKGYIGDGIQQRLTIDPNATQGQNFNAILKQSGDMRRSVGRGAAIGAGIGLLAGPLGALVGGGIGAGIGAFKGRSMGLQRLANQKELLRKEGVNASTLGTQVQLGADQLNKLGAIASNTGMQGVPQLLQAYNKAVESGDPAVISQTMEMVNQSLLPHINNYGLHLMDLRTTAQNRGDIKAAEQYAVQLGQLNTLIPREANITSAQNNQALLANNLGNTRAGLLQALTTPTVAQINANSNRELGVIGQATSFGTADRQNAGQLQVVKAQGKTAENVANINNADPVKVASAEALRVKTEADKFVNSKEREQVLKRELSKSVQDAFSSGNYASIPVFFKTAETEDQKANLRSILAANIAQTIKTSTGKNVPSVVLDPMVRMAEKGELRSKESIFDFLNTYTGYGLPATVPGGPSLMPPPNR